MRKPTAKEAAEIEKASKVGFVPLEIPVTTKVPVADYGRYLAWVDPKYAMLPDAKTPWFMLGVIYTGLMFLLKDARTEK